MASNMNIDKVAALTVDEVDSEGFFAMELASALADSLAEKSEFARRLAYYEEKFLETKSELDVVKDELDAARKDREQVKNIVTYVMLAKRKLEVELENVKLEFAETKQEFAKTKQEFERKVDELTEQGSTSHKIHVDQIEDLKERLETLLEDARRACV